MRRALLTLPLLSACAAAPLVLSRAPEPSAQVEEIRARAFDRHSTDLELSVEIENPGAALQITGADFELLANDQPFGLGELSLDEAVPAGGKARLTVPVTLAHIDLPRAVRERLKEGSPVTLVVRGRFRARAGEAAASIEFDGAAKVAPTSSLDDD